MRLSTGFLLVLALIVDWKWQWQWQWHLSCGDHAPHHVSNSLVSVSAYRIIQVKREGEVETQKFMIHRGNARLVPDEATFEALGYSSDENNCDKEVSYMQRSGGASDLKEDGEILSWRTSGKEDSSAMVHTRICIPLVSASFINDNVMVIDGSSNGEKRGRYKVIQPLPTLPTVVNNPDDVIAAELAKQAALLHVRGITNGADGDAESNSINEKPAHMLQAITYLGHYINPSVRAMARFSCLSLLCRRIRRTLP